jgi:hypothetical protein
MADIHVRAVRDDEAGVWVVESDDVPGLAIEVENREDVSQRTVRVVLELAELNGLHFAPGTNVVFEFVETEERALRYA